MGLKLGSTDVDKLYLGATEITKVYLGSDVVYGGGVSGTELLTAANAAGLANEANNELEWSSSFNFEVETSDTDGSSFAMKVINGADTNALTFLNGLTVVIGDTLVYSFSAKCNTQNEQAVRLNNTSDDTDFWTAGNQPLVWTTFQKTVTADTTSVNMKVTGSPAGQPVTDYILIDNVSVINQGQ